MSFQQAASCGTPEGKAWFTAGLFLGLGRFAYHMPNMRKMVIIQHFPCNDPGDKDQFRMKYEVRPDGSAELSWMTTFNYTPTSQTSSMWAMVALLHTGQPLVLRTLEPDGGPNLKRDHGMVVPKITISCYGTYPVRYAKRRRGCSV